MNNFQKNAVPDYIKKSALDRAGKACQFPSCKANQGLEIYHIDGDDRNNNLNNNLIVLCPIHKSRIRGYRDRELVNWANGISSSGRRLGRT